MKNLYKILVSTLFITTFGFGQDNQSAVLTTSSPTGSSLTTDSTGVVTNFTVGTAGGSTPITWFEYATSFLAFNDGVPLEVSGANADIWDGANPAAPVDTGFFLPARFEDWSFDGANDNEWHTILYYEDIPNNIAVVGGLGYRLEDPSPTLGAGYVTWDPAFQFTNVHSDTVTIEPYRYLRNTAGNTQVTYYSNHDDYNSFWDYDNIDGTSDDYAVEVKYVGGYRYGYAFTGFPMTHYRIQAYAVGNTLYDDITDNGAGYDLTTLTDPVSAHSEFAFQPEAVTLAQDQAALYWLSSKVILVNNSAADHPTDIDLEVKAISANEFNTDQEFADTDASINYSSITYAVNGAGTASTEAKVTVAEITGGMIESGVDATLESVLDTRYWEIFYDTRRTASMASITFTYDVAADGIVDEEQLTVAFRADYSDDWTAWENVVVNEVDNTVTVSNVDAGEGQWALAIKYNQTYVPDDNFELALIELGYDDVLDDYVRTVNISEVTNLDVISEEISDLTGIEDFSSLEVLDCMYNELTTLDMSNNIALELLDCKYNELTTLDVSNNTALVELWCDDNELTTLDVSNNIALEKLFCSYNELTTLDVSNNIALEILICGYNELTTLDVSNNIALEILICGPNNQLTTLDVSNNTALTWLVCNDNELIHLNMKNGVTDALTDFDVTENSLDCIETLDPDYATANWTYENGNIDEGVIFAVDCSPVSINAEIIPLKFQLHNAYPNPFNPITTLRYDLPEQATVNIIIYDIMGREVRTLVNTIQDAGFKSIIWNATNDYGKPVSAGVYLYQIQAGEFVQTKKMVLLK